MPKVRNLKETVLVIPGESGADSIRFGPKEELNIDKITDNIKKAEDSNLVRIGYKPAPTKKGEDKK